MRVVSWNVNGIRACVRHRFVDFVDRSGAGRTGVVFGYRLAGGGSSARWKCGRCG